MQFYKSVKFNGLTYLELDLRYLEIVLRYLQKDNLNIITTCRRAVFKNDVTPAIESHVEKLTVSAAQR